MNISDRAKRRGRDRRVRSRSSIRSKKPDKPIIRAGGDASLQALASTGRRAERYLNGVGDEWSRQNQARQSRHANECRPHGEHLLTGKPFEKSGGMRRIGGHTGEIEPEPKSSSSPSKIAEGTLQACALAADAKIFGQQPA